MIPYDLIVTASHRPHLLQPTLASLLDHIDRKAWPQRILIHDDDTSRRITEGERLRQATMDVLRILDPPMPVVYTWASPPRRMGGALKFLLDQVTSEFVLYSQDDFVTVRRLPIAEAHELMEEYALNQIRFNKRATMAFKETWQGRWEKREMEFLAPGGMRKLTVSDHWYFQTGLWRVRTIRAAMDWLTATPERRDILERAQAEEAINLVMDGRLGQIPGLVMPCGTHAETRAQDQKTFIWGPIGEDRYIRHIGGEDPSGDHPRHGGVDSVAQAWREIDTYKQKEEMTDGNNPEA